MENALTILEDLFHKKIMLYQELAESLKEERSLLAETDMDGLWDVSDKKQRLVEGIEEVRSHIVEALAEASLQYENGEDTFSLASVMSAIPQKDKSRFRQPYLSLVHLKAEVRQQTLENKAFVEQSLDFLDELISIIADTGAPGHAYTNGGSIHPGGPSHVIVSREV